MGKIKTTTVVTHPDTHEPVVLLEGSDAPDWAVKAITNPDVLDQGGEDEPDKGLPSDEWTAADLKAYAEDHKIDLDGATKKADILSALAVALSSDD